MKERLPSSKRKSKRTERGPKPPNLALSPGLKKSGGVECAVHGQIDETKAQTAAEVMALLAKISELETAKMTQKAEIDVLKSDLIEKQKHIAELIAIEKENELKLKQCTCSDKDFVGVKFKPNYGAAKRLFKKTDKIAFKLKAKLDTKKYDLENALYAALTLIPNPIAKEKLFRKSASDTKKDVILDRLIRERAEELATDLMGKRDPTEKDMIDFFEKEKNTLGMFELGKLPHEQPKLFRDICHILGVQKRYKHYFPKLIYTNQDARPGQVMPVWREKFASYPEGSMEQKRELESMAESMEKANIYAATFFSPEELHPDVINCSDINELIDMVQNTLPTTKNDFKKFESAIAKLKLTHLAETIHSSLDLKYLKVVTQHLRRRFTPYLTQLPDGRCILNCSGKKYSEEEIQNIRNDNDPEAILLESFTVGDEKTEIAIARKLCRKDDDTGDFDASSIYDLVRLAAKLTEGDSAPEKTEKSIVKLIAITSAIMLTDITQKRLKTSLPKNGNGDNNDIIEGIINPNSTGDHFSFQLTSRCRYQCRSNGENGGGTVAVRTIPVEQQFQMYATDEDQDKDHKKYERNQYEVITKTTGMNVTFEDFIEDLCDAIIDKEEFDTEPTEEPGFEGDYLHAQPLFNKMSFILGQIFTQKKETGFLENARVIENMIHDPRKFEKLKKVIKTMKESKLEIMAQVIEETVDQLEPKIPSSRPAKSV